MDPRPGIWLLWGKKDRKSSAWHPLLCHLIDVAAVAWVMWHDVLSPRACEQIAAALGVDEVTAGRWISFLAGLHDLGKACPAFQLQDPTTIARLAQIGLPTPTRATGANHGEVTAAVLAQILPDDFRFPRRLALRVAALLGGHHGVFPSTLDVDDLNPDVTGQRPWTTIRRALAQTLADVVGVPLAAVPSQIDNPTAMFVAGLVSVADWIGSNEHLFKYRNNDTTDQPVVDPLEYWNLANGKARCALAQLGWTGWSPSTAPCSFATLIPGKKPNALQEAIVALSDSLSEPGLVIIEAPMGEGKTEAAEYLADHWSVTLGLRGCYFALPTQATSNQMFGRVREFLTTRYPDQHVNLQLLHGHSALSAEFQLMLRNGEWQRRKLATFELQNVYGEDAYDAAPANVVAAEWFTYRKRGLLAPFGVGTIDQALLAVLQTRHVFVRLFGLAHKTIVIDEVHAYDTYMTRLLQQLLRWLGALGSAVVLLSATLPTSRRMELLKAYAEGLGLSSAPSLAAVSYPRVTWLTASGGGAQTVDTSERSTKTVRVEWIDGRLPDRREEEFELGPKLKEALAGGGCAAVICNTVSRAQEVYRQLKKSFPDRADDGWPELDLLHSRYVFEERDKREKRALVRFGKPDGVVAMDDGTSTAVRRPNRAILVSTQIIEQSLDLDFDLMVTDLAPVDLVIQRLGRLCRHERKRPLGYGEPTVWIAEPDATPGGLPHFGPGTEAVYDRHILLRSWLALRGHPDHSTAELPTLAIPGDVEALIEDVYADPPSFDHLREPLRSELEKTWKQHQNDVDEEGREAEDRWLKPPTYSRPIWHLTADPREEDAPDFHQAHQALTRLARPSVSVVVLHGTPEHPTFDAAGRVPVDLSHLPSADEARKLLARSLTISDRRVVHALQHLAPPESWHRSALLRHHHVIVLAEDGRAAIGTRYLVVDDDLGMRIIGPGEEDE